MSIYAAIQITIVFKATDYYRSSFLRVKNLVLSNFKKLNQTIRFCRLAQNLVIQKFAKNLKKKKLITRKVKNPEEK